MRHDSTKQPGSRDDDGIGETARDAAEDAAKRTAGKLIAKAFRWIGRRLGVKDRTPASPPGAFDFERRRMPDRRAPRE